MPYNGPYPMPRFLLRALWRVCGLLAGLPQDAALHRKDEVIDECLQAVAATRLEVGRGRPKQSMRPLFNGIQIR